MSFNILFLKLFSIILIFLAFNFTQKKILSFLTRTLFIICASLILSYIFDYKIIYLGALVSTFLIIWPPIVYLNLLKFPFTTKKNYYTISLFFIHVKYLSSCLFQ